MAGPRDVPRVVVSRRQTNPLRQVRAPYISLERYANAHLSHGAGALPQPHHAAIVSRMTAAALATTPDSTAAAPASKPPRIPKRVRHACDLIASGECTTIKAAAERVKLSREHLSRMISKPHVQVFMQREARRTIALGVMRASHRVVELMDASSEHVSLDASTKVLAIEGIKPAESGTHVSVSVDIKAGYVLDLRDDAHMPHMRETEAKPLIEHATVSHGDTERD
jgi:hypothetical protein